MRPLGSSRFLTFLIKLLILRPLRVSAAIEQIILEARTLDNVFKEKEKFPAIEINSISNLFSLFLVNEYLKSAACLLEML
jgi:hypothetical protein